MNMPSGEHYGHGADWELSSTAEPPLDEGWWKSVRADTAAADDLLHDLPEKLIELDSEISLELRVHEIIKGLFGLGDLMFAYGPSSVGKTFLILHMAFAIALGRATWFGKRVRSVPVLYVGLEGQRGLRRRILAARNAYGVSNGRFAHVLVPAPLDQTERGTKGVEVIVQAAEQLAKHAGEPVGVIIIDTLARAVAGDDENSSQDMSAFVQNRIAAITRRIGAAVIVIHHTGKDAQRGMRGSYALFGAAEAVLKIDERRNVEVEKARDGATGAIGSYKLKQVELGIDEDGDEITTCIVDVVDAADAEQPLKKKRLSARAELAFDMLNRLYADGIARDVPLTDIDLEGISVYQRPKVVTWAEWRAKCREVRLAPDATARNGETMALTRASDELMQANRISRYGEYVWLLAQKRNPKEASQSSP